ncbi:hypothetical protein ACJX0J_035825, partial [Zea mays]
TNFLYKFIIIKKVVRLVVLKNPDTKHRAFQAVEVAVRAFFFGTEDTMHAFRWGLLPLCHLYCQVGQLDMELLLNVVDSPNADAWHNSPSYIFIIYV